MVAIANIGSLYKTIYTDEEVLDLTYKGRVLWAMLKKKTDFFGAAKSIPIIYSPPGGRSATFSDAKSLADDGEAAENFLLTRKFDYQMVNLDGDSVEAAENDEGAFVDLFEEHVDGGLRNLGRELNRSLYRGVAGVRGRIATSGGISSAVIQLAEIKDAIAFEKNMTLKLTDQTDGSSLRTGTIKVLSVNRRLGQITCTGNVTAGIAAAVNGDYIYALGDATRKPHGLDSYCPSSDPSDTLLNVNRSLDPDRLGGIRAGDLSGMSLEEAFLVLNDTMYTIGEAEVDFNVIHSLKYTDFARELGSKKVIVESKYGNVGFKGIAIDHAGGHSVVHGDRDCQADQIWGIEKKALTFHSLKMAPRPLNIKGTTKEGVHFNPDADGIVLRLGWRGNLACRGPALLGRGTI